VAASFLHRKSDINNNAAIIGLADFATSFINSIDILISGAITALQNKVSEFIAAGGKLIGGIVTGFLNSASRVASTFSNIIGKAIDVGVIGKAISVGSDIIKGLIRGIQQMGLSLTGVLGNVVKKALNFTKRLLGISSPSKVFAEVGTDIVGGIQLGVDKGDGIFDPILAQAKTLGSELSSLQVPAMKIEKMGILEITSGEQGTLQQPGLLPGISGQEQDRTAPLNPPATANQINNNNVTQDNSRSTTVNFANNSGGAPISDAAELQFVLASFA